MKKLFMLFVCLVVAICCFTSCGEGESFSALLSEDFEDEYPALSKVTELEDFKGYTLVGHSGPLVYLANSKSEHKIYNLERDKVVLSFGEELTRVSFITAYGSHFAIVITYEDNKSQTVVYSESGVGSEVVKYALDKDSIKASHDLIQIDRTVYRIDLEGELSKVTEYSSRDFSYPDFIAAVGNYYYEVNESKILIYNKNLGLKSSWVCPYSDGQNAIPLENGDLLVQYTIPTPADAKDYDLYYEGEKRELVSLIISAKDGSEKEIKSEYLFVTTLYNASESSARLDGKTIKYKNCLFAIAIEDKRLRDGELLILAVDNGGKVVERLNAATFDPTQGLPEQIGEEHYAYKSIDGKWCVANRDGKLLGRIASIDTVYSNYILDRGRVFDFNFENTFEYTKDGYTLVHAMEHGAIFEKDDDHWLWTAEGGLVEAYEETTSSNQLAMIRGASYYVVRSGRPASYEYSIYSDTGVLLHTFDDMISDVMEHDDAIVVHSGSSFYRITE